MCGVLTAGMSRWRITMERGTLVSVRGAVIMTEGVWGVSGSS